MRRGPLDVYEEPNESGRKTNLQQNKATKLGLALILNGKGARTTTYFDQIVSPAIAFDQIKFFYNDNGRVVGYVIWAYLTEVVSERIQKQAMPSLLMCEWNEGSTLWIIDIVAPYGHFSNIRKNLISNTFGNSPYAFYYRIKRNRRNTVQLTRKVNKEELSTT